ncbi:effector-associated domain EAD1-containing protein [Frankia sp. CIT1]|uniref:effector-associated domain EAD1-containing protein n=1 Tax=Frankia sp. CIT1 TaxID=2880974 RepID=UPI001EF4723A|nr:effector-associated domain EAD1-containing protein [Frankia sp. CIT1]
MALLGGAAHGNDDVRILRSALAVAFSNQTAAHHLLLEIGIPADRHLDWVGLNATLWWAETFRSFENGIAVDPYRRIARAALEMFPGNPVFQRFADLPVVDPLPVPPVPRDDDARDSPGESADTDDTVREPVTSVPTSVPESRALTATGPDRPPETDEPHAAAAPTILPTPTKEAWPRHTRPGRTRARTIGLASGLIAVTVAVAVTAVLVFAPSGDDARTGPDRRVTAAPPAVPFGGFDTARPMLLKGQTSNVTSVAINGSGTVAATGGENGKIILYDTSSGKSTATLIGVHSGRVDALAFSPDGTILASGGMDKTVVLWDLAGHAPPRRMTGHRDNIRSLSFSPDGATLVSASQDHTARVWNIATGEAGVVQADGELWSTEVDPTGRWFVTVAEPARPGTPDSQGKIVLWDINRLQPVGEPAYAPGSVFTASFNPNGTMLATGQDNGGPIVLWHVDQTGVHFASDLNGHGGGVLCLDFTPDGRTLVSGAYDNTVLLQWDVTSGNVETKSLTEPPGTAAGGSHVRELHISANGAALVYAGDRMDAWLWRRAD